jgi:TatD DNase family protein
LTHNIIDAHAHLCAAVFDNDREEVMQRAMDAGVAAIVGVSENLEEVQRNLELAEVHPRLRVAAGLYPTVIDRDQAEAMVSFIRKEHRNLVGIGEVGLDHWAVKGDAERGVQGEIFARFIDVSLELDLPLNIHSRSAGKRAISMLLQRGARKAQLHAFDGKASAALPGVEAGYLFSVPPSIVRSRQKQKLVKQLPLSCLLVESDSPVLGPTAGTRNEPANVVIAVRAISEIKGLSIEEVMEAVSSNAQRLYGGWVAGTGAEI